MKKTSKYGRNPKLNPKTHCVMVRFGDVEWNRFLTMYEKSQLYAKAVFLKAHFSEKKAMVLLYKLEKHTIDLVKLSREIVELSREMWTEWERQNSHAPAPLPLSERYEKKQQCKIKQ